MKKSTKVVLGILIFGIVSVLIGALCYDVHERNRYYKEYQRSLMSLTNSIVELKSDIAMYEEEIASLDLERDSIRKEIQIIFKDNEKIDSYLANGDWDYNLRFLADFLSSEDSVPEWHRSGNNTSSANQDK